MEDPKTLENKMIDPQTKVEVKKKEKAQDEPEVPKGNPGFGRAEDYPEATE